MGVVGCSLDNNPFLSCLLQYLVTLGVSPGMDSQAWKEASEEKVQSSCSKENQHGIEIITIHCAWSFVCISCRFGCVES